jgi:hypothetical protein
MLRVEGTWHYSRVIHAIFLDAQLIIFVNKQCVCSITKLTTSELGSDSVRRNSYNQTIVEAHTYLH